MIYKQYISALAAFFVAITTIQSTYTMFEIKFDGDITVNGQNIKDVTKKTKPAASIAFSLLGGWLAAKYFTTYNQSTQRRLDTMTAGAIVGSVVADVLYKDATPKTILTKTANGIGTIAGTRFKENKVIKDPSALGGHLGKIIASEYYGDRDLSLLSAGEAIGEQLGLHAVNKPFDYDNSVPETTKLIGKKMGSSCGAAVVAHTILDEPDLRDAYLKKATIDAVAIHTTNKYNPVKFQDELLQTAMNQMISETISYNVLSEIV